MSKTGFHHIPRQPHARPLTPALRRPWLPAMLRGARGACPACGESSLYASGLRVVKKCARCGEELYHHRASRISLPIAAFVALQLVALLMLLAHMVHLAWPQWAWALLWTIATVVLLRPSKGAIVGLQWALRLHGFQYAAMCRPRQP